MSSDDEFDAIPDDFEGFDFDAIPDLAITGPAEVTSNSISAIPPRPASAGSSSHYSYDDDIDESILVELDAIEGRLSQGIRDVANASSHPLSHNSALNVTLDPPHPTRMSRFFGTVN
ncbi:hypothetical protein PILCRDRAFT_367384 [Piloderma croceum F 1598]|uniref:Uncharacterized protein n=1 Tax=Piloderma croceum (strain F 1598) TaxID=765440 RepID=A0A0C3C757_PILCF|nr:hypothetical protein PILCRDRAFT_367384 [Piloderma croceum F 1598]